MYRSEMSRRRTGSCSVGEICYFCIRNFFFQVRLDRRDTALAMYRNIVNFSCFFGFFLDLMIWCGLGHLLWPGVHLLSSTFLRFHFFSHDLKQTRANLFLYWKAKKTSTPFRFELIMLSARPNNLFSSQRGRSTYLAGVKLLIHKRASITWHRFETSSNEYPTVRVRCGETSVN